MLYQQGGVYPATLAAISLLIEVAAAAEAPEREPYDPLPDALVLLTRFAELVTGDSALQLLHEFIPMPEPQASIRREEGIDADIRAGIRRGLPVYLELLNRAPGAARQEVARLLSCLTEDRAKSLPALEGALAEGLDAPTRAALFVAMSRLEARAPRASRLRAALAKEESPFLRLVLARELLFADAGASPLEARRLVRDAILAPDEAESDDALSPGGDPIAHLAMALAVADPEMGREVLPELIRAADTAEFISPERAMAILFLARKEGDDPFPKGDITPLMHDAIQAIALKTFQPGGSLATLESTEKECKLLTDVLGRFGLPGSPRGLRALCGIPEAVEQDALVGSTGRVVFSVTKEAGAVEVRGQRLAARCDRGRLDRGQRITVLGYDPVRRRYTVGNAA